ncbi:MAG: twin-arginine translocase TatA/TatE family subunit [Thermodesulfovibrionales bacterium]
MFRGLFQPMHLLVILAIALIVVGPGKLPELGKVLGKTIRDFKKAISGDEKDSASEIQKDLPTKDSPEK